MTGMPKTSKQVTRVAEDVLAAQRPAVLHDMLLEEGGIDLLRPRQVTRLFAALRGQGYLERAASLADLAENLPDAGVPADRRAGLEAEIRVLRDGWRPTVEASSIDPVPGRVLHVVETSLPSVQSGYTLRTYRTVRAQQAAGLDPHVVTHTGFGDAESRHAEDVGGVSHHRLPGASRGSVPLDAWLDQHVQQLAALCRELRPAVLHAASDWTNALSARVVGTAVGIPVVYESRGFWEETWLSRQAAKFGWDLEQVEREWGLPDAYVWRHALEDRLRAEADHVVTLGRVMRDRIVTGGVPPERVSVVPNAVDVDEFPLLDRDTELAAELGIGADEVVVGYISSLVEYEGVDTLIDAVAELRARAGARVRLLVVGHGAEEEALRARATAAGLDGAAIFTGQVPHVDVLRYYSLIDVFVVPRRPVTVCQLVTPLKPYEALSTGRTLVMSDVAALREIAEDSGAAELFTPLDPTSLADVVEALVKDPARRARMSAEGAAWVRSARTWALNAQAYVGVYESLGAV
jgi:glycosyltransferase involved in cell wall biosynthesis